MLDASSDVHFTYDDSGAVRAERQTQYGQPSPLKSVCTHDYDGNVDSIAYPHGDVVNYAYDAQERCTGMWAGNTTLSAYGYSGDWLTYRGLANGLYTAYDHQLNGRLWDVWHIDAGRNKSISRRCCGYAPNGQVNWSDREPDGSPAPSLENGRGDAFYYWPDGSLGLAARDVGAAGGWPGLYSATADSRLDTASVSYAGGSAATGLNNYGAYDQAGNRAGQVAQMNQPAVNYAADSLNRYPALLGYNDGRGNTTDDLRTGCHYAYDAENKLTSASGPGRPVRLLRLRRAGAARGPERQRCAALLLLRGRPAHRGAHGGLTPRSQSFRLRPPLSARPPASSASVI